MSVSEIFKETFLNEIAELLANKQFNNFTFAPCEENDDIVGEMTDLEKAIFTLAKNKSAEHNEIANELRDEGKIAENLKTMHKLKGQVDILKSLCWQIIEDRLCLNGDRISLREGCKIVKMEKQEIFRHGSLTIVGLSSFTKLFL
jgi:hypothetical protein